jgi:hypothetical protein
MINHGEKTDKPLDFDARFSKAMVSIYSDKQEDAEKIKPHFVPSGQRTAGPTSNSVSCPCSWKKHL